MQLISSHTTSTDDFSTEQENLVAMNSHSCAAFFLGTIAHFRGEFSPGEVLQIKAMERTSSYSVFVLSPVHVEHAPRLDTGTELIP